MLFKGWTNKLMLILLNLNAMKVQNSAVVQKFEFLFKFDLKLSYS